MKIFISWSKRKSRRLAEELAKLLRLIFDNRITIFFSPEDIKSGQIWFNKIAEELNDTSFGIICLTKDNTNNPWILFETGALFKGLTSNKVVPVLIDIKTGEVEDPLKQFNCRHLDEDSLRLLVKDINTTLYELSGSCVTTENLYKYFNLGWNEFYEASQRIKFDIEKIEPIELDISQMIYHVSPENQALETIKVTNDVKNKNKRAISFVKDKHGSNIKGFIMLAYIYSEPKNWIPYYTNNYILSYKIKASEAIGRVTIEIKRGINGVGFFDKVIDLHNGEGAGCISLRNYDENGYSEIKEICFTIFNEYFSADGKYEFEIDKLELKPSS